MKTIKKWWILIAFIAVTLMAMAVTTPETLMEALLLTLGMLMFTASIAATVAASKYMERKGWLKRDKTGKTGKDDEGPWWTFYKPHFAIPTAWGLLHLVYLFLFPDAFKETFTNHLGSVAAVETTIFVINTITNRNVVFAERYSLTATNTTYIIVFIFAISTIPANLFYGDVIARWDREMYIKMSSSRASILAEKIRQNSARRIIEPKMKELKELNEKSRKGDLSKKDRKKVITLTNEIKYIALAGLMPREKSNRKKTNESRIRSRRLKTLKSPFIVFTIPRGDGNNTKQNIVYTNLFPTKGSFIHYIVERGVPVRVRTGLSKNDFIEVSSNVTTRSNGKGEIQFLKWNPARVKVHMTM